MISASSAVTPWFWHKTTTENRINTISGTRAFAELLKTNTTLTAFYLSSN